MSWTMMTGKQIKALRVKVGMSQRELARQMAISTAYLCDIEKGRRKNKLQLEHAEAILSTWPATKWVE